MTAARPPLSAAAADCRSDGRDLRSVHPLLVEGLKVTDDLGNHADQLSGDVGDILLRQLPLLLAKAEARRTTERCLGAEILRGMAKSGLTKPELTETEAAR
jgi:hypothetical protein